MLCLFACLFVVIEDFTTSRAPLELMTFHSSRVVPKKERKQKRGGCFGGGAPRVVFTLEKKTYMTIHSTTQIKASSTYCENQNH